MVACNLLNFSTGCLALSMGKHAHSHSWPRTSERYVAVPQRRQSPRGRSKGQCFSKAKARARRRCWGNRGIEILDWNCEHVLAILARNEFGSSGQMPVWCHFFATGLMLSAVLLNSSSDLNSAFLEDLRGTSDQQPTIEAIAKSHELPF